MCNPSSNTTKQLMSRSIIRSVQGDPERQFIRRAMTFENQATQAQQRRAVVATMVNSIFKRI
jgi:hypothetical protein